MRANLGVAITMRCHAAHCVLGWDGVAQNALIKHLGVSAEDWHAFEQFDSAGFMESGMSLCVRHQPTVGDTPKMVAFLSAQVFSFAKPLVDEKLLRKIGVKEPQKFKPLLDFGMSKFLVRVDAENASQM